MNEKYDIERKVQLVITTPFKSINKFNISKKGDYAIIVGNPNNKIHIYSLIDFQLKFCLDSEFQQHKIINISISKKTKFFSIMYNDNDIEIYKLTDENKVNQICKCINHIIDENEKISPKKKGFLNTIINVKVIFFYLEFFFRKE